MSDIENARDQRPLARLVTHLNNPLFRNGYALILSVATTSGLGFVYWILAARSYPADTVGINSAAIAAMMFLGGIAQLNMTSALIRFTPVAGRDALRFITATFGVGAAVAILLTAIFLLGLNTWAPALGFLGSSPAFVLWFFLASIGWCIFVLQDSALVGLRQATWVPIKNTIFAVGKIILMLAFIVLTPSYGLFASWTVAMAVSVIFTNLIIFQGVRPEFKQEGSSLIVPQIIRYVAADYIGSLFWLAAATLLPLIVTAKAGAAANAYFFLAWQTAYLLYHVSASMGSSLIVEASRDPNQLSTFTYRVVMLTLLLLVPSVGILVVGAPYILSIFGPEYSAEASTLLRLLGLSAIPYMVNILFVSVSRVQRKMKNIIAAPVAMGVLILILSVLLIDVYGITGVGLAYLIGQGVVALAVIATHIRPILKGGMHHIPHLEAVLSFLPDFLLLEKQPRTRGDSQGGQTPTSWTQPGAAEIGIPVTARPTVQPGVAAITALNRTAKKLRPILNPRRTGIANLSAAEQARVSQLLASILPEIHHLDGQPEPRTWKLQRFIPTVTDLAVFTIGPNLGPPAALLKIAQSRRAAAAIDKQVQNLAALRVDTRLGDWRSLLPQVLFNGSRSGREVLVERMIPGWNASRLFSNPILSQATLQAAVAAVEQLHLNTAQIVCLDREYFNRWVEAPIDQLRRLTLPLSSMATNSRVLDRLAERLQGELIGKCTTTSWIHGDYSPDNILMASDGSAVRGIIDWELSRSGGLPGLDFVQLMVTFRMARTNRELGEVVRNLIFREDWTPEEQEIFRRMRLHYPGDQIAPRTLLLLAWLLHITANINNSDRFNSHWVWKTANIEPVLRIL